jgi:hypothetical protein
MGSSRGSVMLLGEGLLGLTVPLCPRGAMSNAIKGFGFTGHQLVFEFEVVDCKNVAVPAKDLGFCGIMQK